MLLETSADVALMRAHPGVWGDMLTSRSALGTGLLSNNSGQQVYSVSRLCRTWICAIFLKLTTLQPAPSVMVVAHGLLRLSLSTPSIEPGPVCSRSDAVPRFDTRSRMQASCLALSGLALDELRYLHAVSLAGRS
jgi:hypothetical protein